jgi:hypothetical protein
MVIKRRGRSDFGGADADPTILTLEGRNGLAFRVPTREAKDYENGHELTVHVPDLEGYAPCKRCGGDWTRDRHVLGGWLMHFQRQGETWYPAARACPDCVWGAYRHHCTRAPFQLAFGTCSVVDLAMLGQELKPGVLTLRAGIELVPFEPVRGRLRRGIEKLELREQYREPLAEAMQEEAPALGPGF